MSKIKAILLFTMLMVAVSGCGSSGKEAHDVGEGGKQFEGWHGPCPLPLPNSQHFRTEGRRHKAELFEKTQPFRF